MKYAFRCKTCGRKEVSDNAAEAQHPHCCCVCGAGVGWTPKGVKLYHPENWEVLADCTPERLAELELTPEQVERHEPWPRHATSRPPKHIHVTAEDGPGTTDGT